MQAITDFSNVPPLACFVFGLAIIFSLIVVPIIRTFAKKWGIVDSPDPERKLHSGNIALGGGIAVFCSTVVATAVTLLLSPQLTEDGASLEWNNQWTVLMVASAAIVALGLIDDWIVLRGRQKLIGQILVTGFVVCSGTCVRQIDLLGWEISLGIFAIPITMLWLIGALNALNLIDGADGMATTTGAIVSAGLAAMALMQGMPLAAVVALALSGSLLGFLVYNRPPATIFLGDAGSMMIGLIIGVLAIWGSVKESTVLAVAPLAALSLPLFDSAIAILRRILTGRSLYAGDRGHLHHRLLARFSHERMLVIVASLCAITTLSAVASVALGQQWVAILGSVVALGSLVATRSFGNTELKMLATRGAHFGESLLTCNRSGEQKAQHKGIQLQGSRCWDDIWSGLVEYADNNGYARIKLDLNIAWMHEGFHGFWQRAKMPEKFQQLVVKIPVIVDQRQVGNLEVIGNGLDNCVIESLEILATRIQDLQPEIERLISETQETAAVDSAINPVSASIKRESAEPVLPNSHPVLTTSPGLDQGS